MIHLFKKGTTNKTLIMLHGTGGDEYSLINLAKEFSQNDNILTIRGNVKEEGMNRYFKRLQLGVYDLDSFYLETKTLINTIKNLSLKYDFNIKEATLIGFSNGANIIQGILLLEPKLFNKYIMFSPDYIDPSKEFGNLDNIKIFISSAKNDPIISFDNVLTLKTKLENKNAHLTFIEGDGHKINLKILTESVLFYQNT